MACPLTHWAGILTPRTTAPHPRTGAPESKSGAPKAASQRSTSPSARAVHGRPAPGFSLCRVPEAYDATAAVGYYAPAADLDGASRAQRSMARLGRRARWRRVFLRSCATSLRLYLNDGGRRGEPYQFGRRTARSREPRPSPSHRRGVPDLDESCGSTCSLSNGERKERDRAERERKLDLGSIQRDNIRGRGVLLCGMKNFF
ncbi:hypothetical protein PAHAL_9G543700 [Panicum hallii]|uniref:Uncharacterized protein n=1 Tax=Panicum hallii TaxID=206008 RepID=A0A2T8I5P6_9POAL|nr:hypothetical protein PAHAL_9G543700 [Panicum hallii]